ncbi:MAG: hypothetical protein Kow0090_09330 [Myxococcota bacterium]
MNENAMRRMSRLVVALAGLLLVPFGARGDHTFSDSDGDGIPDKFDLFPCDASRTALLSVPGEGEHGLIMLEDEWPNKGDMDFNDAVVSYNFAFALDKNGNVSLINLTFNILALGGETNMGLATRLPVPKASAAEITRRVGESSPESLDAKTGEEELTIVLVENIRELFDPDEAASAINVREDSPPVSAPPLEATVVFYEPLELDTAKTPFDLYFFKSDAPSIEIHLPQYFGTKSMDRSLFGVAYDGSSEERFFVDKKGVPYIIHIPKVTKWALEGYSIDRLFPKIVEFAASGGRYGVNFYNAPIIMMNAWLAPEGAGAPPVPHFSGSSLLRPDYSCTFKDFRMVNER